MHSKIFSETAPAKSSGLITISIRKFMFRKGTNNCRKLVSILAPHIRAFTTKKVPITSKLGALRSIAYIPSNLLQLDRYYSHRVPIEMNNPPAKQNLYDIGINLQLPADFIDKCWESLERHYILEEHRAYHNLTHINTLIEMSQRFQGKIQDYSAVSLAILFHDIFYDPTSKSNEEESAELFEKLFANRINENLLKKVSHYIIETKKHSVSESNDKDLKFFIDFDMSIVGVERNAYVEYARQIRKEYSHVPEQDYCVGRAAALQSFLASGHIFATDEFREEMEARARGNIEWECSVLSSGKLV